MEKHLYYWFWICGFLFVSSMSAVERMTVSVCVKGSLDAKIVSSAQTVAETSFSLFDVVIRWAGCNLAIEGDVANQQHWFTVRLRDGRPFLKPAPDALDTLGEAFLSPYNVSYFVDVYHQTVESLAVNKEVEFAVLLGYVIAHELGHLLLGPGHAKQGVMRPSWERSDFKAISQGFLKFSAAEGFQMRQSLRPD